MVKKATEKTVNKAIINMEEALLGVAELEEGVLKTIKGQLDKLLDRVYTQMKEYKHIAALDSMIVENPITQVDPALVAGLEHVASALNDKNQEIVKLQHMLEGLGLEVSLAAGQSVEMLRQHLDELNKRNRILREIHNRLRTHPMMTGRIPRGVTVKEIKSMLEKLNAQIKALNKTNLEMKQQIKPQNEKKIDRVDQSAPRRGPR